MPALTKTNIHKITCSTLHIY